MAGTVRDSRLETRGARERLRPGEKFYWRTLLPGLLHLGYRRRRGACGVWYVRRYLGEDVRTREDGSTKRQGRYSTKRLGLADDRAEADGKTVLTFAQAQAHAQADHPRTKGGALTVADAIARYVEWMRGQGKATPDEVAKRAALHILPEFGAVKVEELTTDQLNRWRDSLAASPALFRSSRHATSLNFRETPDTDDARRARRSTANKSITILKAALNRAFKDGLVDSDREWRRFESFDNVEAVRERSLTVDEVKRLINAAENESGFRDLLHAAILTGCRFGELIRLRCGDFADDKVTILKSKSGKPRRVILTDEGVEFFSQLVAGRDPKEIMLPNRRLKREWRKSEQNRPMRAACAAARIEPLGIHQLRHTWASLSVMGGVPLLVVASNLGHANTKMVEKHYGHITDSYKETAIRAGAPKFGLVGSTTVAPLRQKRR
jgi:integrase